MGLIPASRADQPLSPVYPPAYIRVISTFPEPIYMMSGHIYPDTEDRLRAAIGNRKGGILRLHGTGGSVDAALAMGRMVRAAGIKTFVPKKWRCVSACAMVWAAGTERFVGNRAALGFHRPWYFDGTKYVDGETSDVVAYYRDLGFNDRAIEKFLWPAAGLFWITKSQAQKLGIDAKFDY